MKKSAKPSDTVVNQINEARRRSERKLQSETRDVIYAELCRLKDDEIDDFVVSILEARGIDPDRYWEYVNDDDEPTVVFKPRKPFGLDALDDCYQDACSAAGGEWADNATVRGCKAGCVTLPQAPHSGTICKFFLPTTAAQKQGIRWEAPGTAGNWVSV